MRPFFRKLKYSGSVFAETCNSRCTDNGNRRAQLRLTNDGLCDTLREAFFFRWLQDCSHLYQIFKLQPDAVVYRQNSAVLEDSLFAIGNRVPDNPLRTVCNTVCQTFAYRQTVRENLEIHLTTNFCAFITNARWKTRETSILYQQSRKLNVYDSVHWKQKNIP